MRGTSDVTAADITTTVLAPSGVSLSDAQTMKIDNEDVGAPDSLTIGTFSDASGLAVMMTGFGGDSDQAGFTARGTPRSGWTEVTDRDGASWPRTLDACGDRRRDKSDNHRCGVQRDGRRGRSKHGGLLRHCRAV